MLDKEDFGKFYVSLPRGRRGDFILCIMETLHGSYSRWRYKLVKWSKGILLGKPLPTYVREVIGKIMTEKRWKRY